MKRLFLIGGGEIRSFETYDIDAEISSAAKEAMKELHPDMTRANALFIGTAGGDFMPYYNSFHKMYTGKLGLKTDVALTVYTEMSPEKLRGKFDKADMIYIGGGDTLFMLDHWKKTGLLGMISEAYERGVVIAGLSAGAICWGTRMYTDSASNGDELYHMEAGLGLLPFGICPHYDDRREDFAAALKNEASELDWLCIGNRSALEFCGGSLVRSLSCADETGNAGHSYLINKTGIREL